jgi:hypothetical protein
LSKFSAKLRGRFEVPPVDTDARGRAQFKLSSDGTRLFFRLFLEDIEEVTMAHIHLGEKGENGPVVVTLFGTLEKPVTIVEAEFTGVITRKDLEGPLEGCSLETLLREMKQGNTYVNVHTFEHPDGEIRGQIYRQ